MDILHKIGCNLSPVSIDEIEPNLFLGSLAAARDMETLTKFKITHILTIDTCPLPRNISELANITTMFIHLSDLPKEDILSNFSQAISFIQEGVANGAVLVHCYFGVSRSATLVLAYIMQKYQLSYHEAFEKVKAKRSIIYPNQGFVSQLKLYRHMGYTIEKSDKRYKLFRLNTAADWMRKVKILPQDFKDLIQPDPGLPQSNPDPNVYRCKKCRRVLACEHNLIIHLNSTKSKCSQMYFVEPMAWMNVSQVTQGKLHCPKCSNKVGSFSWVMGCQCPCGVKVAPAFYLVPSKIDYTNVVKNIEVTF